MICGLFHFIQWWWCAVISSFTMCVMLTDLIWLGQTCEQSEFLQGLTELCKQGISRWQHWQIAAYGVSIVMRKIFSRPITLSVLFQRRGSMPQWCCFSSLHGILLAGNTITLLVSTPVQGAEANENDSPHPGLLAENGLVLVSSRTIGAHHHFQSF